MFKTLGRVYRQKENDLRTRIYANYNSRRVNAKSSFEVTQK